MAQQQFHPRPPDTPKLDGERVEIPIPLTQPETAKPPILQRILPIVMMVAVGGMVVLMISMSGSFNPYMMMMPLMLLVGVLGFLGGNGSSNSDLNGERRNYFLALREQRTLVHKQGKKMFEAQEMAFPQPSRLASLVGIDEPNVPSMWTVRAANPGGFVTRSGTEHEKAFRPYLAARLGRGTVELEPQIVTKELPVAEQLEPVTLGAHRKFLRIQRFVPGFPIGYYLGRAPFHSLVGDDERVLPLVRAMIASLAFNHSPDELELVLISDDPDGPVWSAFKWLPHVNDPSRMTADGPARRIYRSLNDFADDLPDEVRQRPEFQGSNSAPTDGTEREYPHMVVIVDLPAAQVRLPEPFGVGGIDGITLLVVRAGVNDLPSADDVALVIDQDGKISTAVEPALITADAMGIGEFDAFAHMMAGYSTGTEIVLPGLIDHTPKALRRTSYLTALGVEDLESFDAYQFWARRANDRDRRIPLGDLIDEKTMLPTGKLAELSFSESSIGGSGPHGVGQGTTGTGKSFLLQPLVLSLAALYSPEQVAFILMDFKGGATFQRFEKLPHVLANITNLAKDKDLLVRGETVIRGELIKRQEIFDEAKVPDILAYNKLRAKDPDKYPPLPELFIIVDEFGEFIDENRDFLKLFSSITRVGRSLGVHLLLFSQFINQQIIGDIKKNLSFGLSLKVEEASDSTYVIGSAAATHLKKGAGHAYLRRSGDDEGLVMMQGFDVAAPYVPIIAPVADIAVSGDSLTDAASDTTMLVPFTSISSAPLDVDGDDPVVIEETVIANADEYPEVRQALLDALVRFQDVQPRQLWQPTLTAPISFYGAEPPATNERGLAIRIGDLDDPANHRRIPYTIHPEGAGAHIRVIGARGSGKSTTLQTLIASAAFTYDPTQVQFYLIDFGSKLREVEHYPNVGARASGTDNELIDRIIAEFKRVVAVRVDEFEARGVSSFAAYAESRISRPAPADMYGEMFLVIDGIDEFLPSNPDPTQQQTVDRRMSALIEIAKAGGSRGIHLVIAGDVETGKMRFYNEFGLYILHPSSEPTQVTTMLKREHRNTYTTIPTDQPGRVVEPVTGLHARVFVPQLEAITPIPGTDPAAYDPNADYSAGIRALGDLLTQRYTAPGPNGEPQQIRAWKITTVDANLPWEKVWPVYLGTRPSPTAPRSLPLGAAIDDLSLVMLPVDDPQSVPYLLVVGDAQSGRTNTVRSLLRSIMEQYRPDEAQVYLFDPGYKMMTESKILDQLGLLASYETKPSQIAAQAESIASIVSARQPDDTVTADQIASGSWYDGPKIFVIIDPVSTLVGGYEAAPTDALVSAIEMQRDLGMSLGLHVIATESTNQFMSRRSGSKFYKALAAANADILMLSGTHPEPVAGGIGAPGGKIAFARRRPGLGQLYSPSTGRHPVVQTLLHPPFD